MKILITGGAVFIGSHLVDLLVKKKFTVAVFDNLSLGNPNRLPGGAYFSKLSNDEERFMSIRRAGF